MANAQFGKEDIDCPDVHAAPSAAISQVRRSNVIVAIRNQEWYGRKPVQNLVAGFRTREALQKLLNDEAGRKDGLAALDCADEKADLRHRGRCIPPERKRPDAAIDENGQRPERSAL